MRLLSIIRVPNIRYNSLGITRPCALGHQGLYSEIIGPKWPLRMLKFDVFTFGESGPWGFMGRKISCLDSVKGHIRKVKYWRANMPYDKAR